jgi:hypothetical protein
MHMVVAGTSCSGLPVCAIVVAVFEGAPWKAARQGTILSWMNKQGKPKDKK